MSWGVVMLHRHTPEPEHCSERAPLLRIGKESDPRSAFKTTPPPRSGW